MSSLKSLAAAKSRRSGEQQHISSGNRPITSIASQSAFAGQYQGRNPAMQQQYNQNPRQMQNQNQMQEPQSNGLPFSKLTVSDAIGLITLRLGKVEQFLIDVQQEGGFGNNSSETNIPANTKLIDNSVLTNIINRLDSLEKGGHNNNNNNNNNNVNIEVVSKLEKELKETREMLMNLLFKFELFSKETTNKFTDYELAIGEIEKNMHFTQNDGTTLDDNTILNTGVEVESDVFLSAELKNMIKEEFSEPINYVE
jgi:hypothetical protein